MIRKSDGLESMLRKLRSGEFERFMEKHRDEFITNDKEFEIFMKDTIASRRIQLKDIFIIADIPEKYGYKLLSGEKHTRQRDIILRICYASEMNVDETQYALKLYGMPELFAMIPRDALIMVCFGERPGNVIDVNRILKENKFQTLRTSGVQE